MSFQRSTRRMLRAFVSISALAVLAICGALVVAAHAAAEPSVVTGRGVWIANHTDFVGYYRAYVNGHWLKVYCVSPDRRVPLHVTLRTVSSLPAANAATTRLLAETLSAHGNAQTATEAEAVSQALNEEIDNSDAVARRAKYLSKAVRDLAARYVAEAHARRGPYTLSLHLPASPAPGLSWTGTVRLHSAAGGIAETIALRGSSNVKTPSSVRTNRTGTAFFPYRTLGGGLARVTATARVAPTRLQASTADRSTQVMLTWTPRAVVRAGDVYQPRVPSFTHHYSCTSECAGRPRVTLTTCAPANGYPSRITYWLGREAHRFDFAAAEQRVCRSWQVRIADRVSVSARWRYRTPHGWTAPITAEGAFVVDCPAAPPVAVQLSYNCTYARLSAVLGRLHDGQLVPVRNSTRHTMVLEMTGWVSGRFELRPGATAVRHTIPFACGSAGAVTFRGGVQRAQGGYNYGPAAGVSLP